VGGLPVSSSVFTCSRSQCTVAPSGPATFQYHDKGSMATIGHKHAVADAFGLKLTGLPAYVMWGLVHVAYLIDGGSRLGTLYAWSRA
jgi:NADH dehydrogenase